MTKCGVYTNAGRELAVPSTKSFTSQIVVMLLVGLWFASIKETDRAPIKRQELISELLGLSFHAQKTLETEQKCVRIARMLKDVEHVFIVGRGTGEPIAFEAALKIKEMCYIHATGLSGGEFKHGPLALIQSGTIVFAILLDDKNAKRMVISCSELNSRGAKLVIVTDNAELARELDFCDLIETPKMGAMSAFLTVLSFQLIAFHAALERGINPDKPRNLAKSVTVD